MADHTIHLGADEECAYLVRAYDDGTHTISTRPVGGVRWSREVKLVEQSAEVTC